MLPKDYFQANKNFLICKSVRASLLLQVRCQDGLTFTEVEVSLHSLVHIIAILNGQSNVGASFCFGFASQTYCIVSMLVGEA